MKRSKVIDNANIKAGDVIVGLASLGSQPMRKVIMAVWEVTDLHLHVMMFFGNIWQPSTRRAMMLPFLKT
jgi:hypothetical protein